jgi:hypothetical protein
MTDNVYSNVEDFLSSLDDDGSPSDTIKNSDNKEFNQELYKKWFRSKTQSGFLAIRPWHQALKMKLDIGKTSPEGKLISSTAVFVDAIDFAAYLKSITTGNAVTNYPQNEKMGVPTNEGFVSYGGAVIDGKPISRIFKAHYWQSSESYDSTSFVWKCGHFAARKSDSGAFIPDMKSPLSVDQIKVTRQDICSISYLMDLSLTSYVTNNQDWYEI